jgi:hypothetical protein
MITEPLQSRARAARNVLRRRELEDWLSAFDVPGAPRYRRIRHSLEAMGPVFMAFGRYLSTRIDLLPEILCEELACIPDGAMPSEPAAVAGLFIPELGCPPERVFAEFDPRPFESRIFWQAHHARVGNVDVVVRVIHPETTERLPDADILPDLSGTLAEYVTSVAGFQAAVADFQRLLPAATSFAGDIHAAGLLAQDAQVFDLLGAPRIHAHLCTPHVAICGGYRKLDEGLGAPVPDLARTLCLLWLRQALEGLLYPVDPRPENIGFASDERIVFHHGPFATLPETGKTHVWNYLIAVASEKVDEAATHLAAGMGGLTNQGCEKLRRQFRQMVPFRDGFRKTEVEGDAACEGRRFTDELLIHWRIANQDGLMDSKTLIPFYRGLFTIAKTAQGLAPGRDPLAEALRDLRLLKAFDQVKDVMRPSQTPALIENYATALTRMPGNLDRLLTLASGARPMGEHRPSEAPDSATQNRSVAAVCLLALLAGAGMLLHKVSAAVPDAFPHWIPPVLFLVLGLFALRAVSRLG